MRLVLCFVLTLVISTGLLFSGCSSQQAKSGKEAIELSKAMETVEEKVNYLVSQAKAFYNSEDFQQTVDIAQYILTYLDKESERARSLLEQAKAAIQDKAQSVVNDTASKLGLGN